MIAVAIILNGVSRKKKKFYSEIYPLLADKFSIKTLETQWAGHALDLAAQATADGHEFIIAAGGDGTLNQVINGVLQNKTQTSYPAVGLIPLGTGNDFARACGLGTDAEQLIRLLQTNQPRPTDIGRLTCFDEAGEKNTRYFINACSVGMGPAVVKRLVNSSRALGPALTYLKAIALTFTKHIPQEVRCLTPLWEWHGSARVLVIANAQSFGHSIYIAPDALLDDGLLNVFVAGDISLWKFLIYLQRLKAKKKIKDRLVVYNKTRLAELSAAHACPIEVEGELAGYLPATVEVLPKKINFLR